MQKGEVPSEVWDIAEIVRNQNGIESSDTKKNKRIRKDRWEEENDRGKRNWNEYWKDFIFV